MKQISIIVPCFNEQERCLYFFRRSTGYARGFLSMNSSGFRGRRLQGWNSFTLKRESKGGFTDKIYFFFQKFWQGGSHLCGPGGCKRGLHCRYGRRSPGSARLLPEMIEALESGDYDSAATRRVDRKGNLPVRSFFARMFYRLIRKSLT